MKSMTTPLRLIAIASLLVPRPWTVVLAAETNSTPATTEATQVVVPEKLPYGVDDVLKLSRSQVSEDLILNYVQNSGTVYNLTPDNIVYLKGEGMSDRVVGAMLDQRKKINDAAAATVSNQVAQAESPLVAPVYYEPNAGLQAPGYLEPEPVYVEVAPAPSTVYVIPYPYARAAYYGSYRPSGYYTSYGGPAYYRSPGYGRSCGSVVIHTGGGGGYYHHR